MKHYTIISTFPENRGSANVGDMMIREAEKSLIELIKGPTKFTTYFREDPLEDHLDEINRTDAVLMPVPIRDTPLYPNTIRLVECLSDIKVPIIAMPANYNVYPGDEVSRENLVYSKETVDFLKFLANSMSYFPCREYYTCAILQKHGIQNTLMTGDPVWYDPAYFGKSMHRPEKINRLVFSPPLSPYYISQAKELLTMLAELYPDAERICAMHLSDSGLNPYEDQRATNDASMSKDVATKNAQIRNFAEHCGFEVRELSGDVQKLEFYKDCDLHVGYECHAHVSFFRWRRPSVLIAEDARGIGFNYTFGVGGFDGFRRCQDDPLKSSNEGGTSGYCVTLDEYSTAPCDHTVIAKVRQFLIEEMNSKFRRYSGVAEFIDDTYKQVMEPFLKSIS
mgnify:CR=1 FL=1